jgi:hypothetical protein
MAHINNIAIAARTTSNSRHIEDMDSEEFMGEAEAIAEAYGAFLDPVDAESFEAEDQFEEFDEVQEALLAEFI